MEYIRFDIVRFLKDAKKWDKELAELNNRYSELDKFNELCILEGETVLVIKERIQLKIERIEGYRKALDSAVFILNKKERECLRGFFFSDTPVGDYVEKWIKENHSNMAYCYDFREKVLEKMAAYMLDYFQDNQ